MHLEPSSEKLAEKSKRKKGKQKQNKVQGCSLVVKDKTDCEEKTFEVSLSRRTICDEAS